MRFVIEEKTKLNIAPEITRVVMSNEIIPSGRIELNVPLQSELGSTTVGDVVNVEFNVIGQP